MFKLILEKLLNAFGYESSRQKKAREAEAYAQREIQQKEQREEREREIQQKEQRVKLAQGLIEHLMPQVALNYCMGARPIDQLLSESSRELKGEVLQRFQAEVLELCKKTLDSRIQSDKKMMDLVFLTVLEPIYYNV